MADAMLTVVENPGFLAQARGVLSEQEKADTISMIAANPTLGSLIRGTGGIRKVRVALPGKGKSGGARVVYFNEMTKCPFTC